MADETFKKAAFMSECVRNSMDLGYSRQDSEKFCETFLDEELAKRRSADVSPEKKHGKHRGKTSTQEMFDELMRRKIHTRRG